MFRNAIAATARPALAKARLLYRFATSFVLTAIAEDCHNSLRWLPKGHPEGQQYSAQETVRFTYTLLLGSNEVRWGLYCTNSAFLPIFQRAELSR